MLRIIGGKWRSRKLRVAARPGVRPTPNRVRETLFNWLGQDLHGLACLDLFAGSGALGFEAASRGAARVVLVERDPLVIQELQRSRETLGAGQVEIERADAAAFLARGSDVFDVVFLDPPFRQNALPPILARLQARLASGARLYVESDTPLESPDWTELRRGQAGQVSYQLLSWRGPQEPRGSES